MAIRETPREENFDSPAHQEYGAISAAEVEQYISGIDFPCDKQELINHARSSGAPDEILDLMEDFPDQEYDSPVDVARGMGRAS